MSKEEEIDGYKKYPRTLIDHVKEIFYLYFSLHDLFDSNIAVLHVLNNDWPTVLYFSLFELSYGFC